VRLAAAVIRPYLRFMFAKLTARNQLTLPKRVVDALGSPSHFQIEISGDRLVLTPDAPSGAAAVRRKLAALGITDEDVREAVAWARHGG